MNFFQDVSLAHYVTDLIDSQYPQLATFLSDFSSVHGAVKCIFIISYYKFCQISYFLSLDDIQEIQGLATSFINGIKAIQAHLATPTCDEIFKLSLSLWVSESFSKLDALSKELDAQTEGAKGLGVFFAEAPGTTCNELFGIVSGFVNSVEVPYKYSTPINFLLFIVIILGVSFCE